MPIYCKFGDIDGGVTSKKYEKWIEVNSFQWGVGRGISSPTGGDTDRESSAPSVSEIVVTKTMDCASPKLLENSLWGEGVKVEVHFCKTDKDAVEPYLKYELEDTMISGYSLSSGGDRPSESLSFNFTKVTQIYIPMKDKNETGDPYPVGYDLALQASI